MSRIASSVEVSGCGACDDDVSGLLAVAGFSGAGVAESDGGGVGTSGICAAEAAGTEAFFAGMDTCGAAGVIAVPAGGTEVIGAGTGMETAAARCDVVGVCCVGTCVGACADSSMDFSIGGGVAGSCSVMIAC